MKFCRAGPQLVFTVDNRFFHHQACYSLLASPGHHMACQAKSLCMLVSGWERGGDRVCNIYFMYLRAILCTFQISVDFYYIPVGGRGRAGEGGRAKERGIECILYGYS